MDNFAKIFAGVGIIIQLVVFYLTNDTILSLISGVSGVMSVVLCSQRKLAFYWWVFLQLFTYVYLCYTQCLWGEIIENTFYFITMILGIYLWKNNYTDKVITRSLGKINFAVIIFCVVTIFILYNILKITNDTQPFLDSVTTVPAFIAQILMIYRFKEQWLYWLIIDVASVIMWIIAGNYCMAAQFVFWACNCVYGFYKWNELCSEEE